MAAWYTTPQFDPKLEDTENLSKVKDVKGPLLPQRRVQCLHTEESAHIQTVCV